MSPDPMRLLFAIRALGNVGGGAERVLVDVVNGLTRRGHSLGIVTFDPPERPSYYMLDGRVEHLRIPIGDPARTSTAGETLRRIAPLRACVRGWEPEVAVGFMHSMFLPLGFALVGSGIPLVASDHMVATHYLSHPMERALLRATPMLTRATTVMSPSIRDDFPRRLRRRMVVLPNPVSLHDERGARPALPQDPVEQVDARSMGRRRLLTVGRLTQQKDHATLVDAFALLARRHEGWDLRIIGIGELHGELKAHIERLGLTERIDLAGFRRDIAAEHLQADLFVMPSRYESFGLAVAEAMQVGVPVVGFSDCPGVNELIRDGINGILVTGQDRVRALADGLDRLMSDDRLRARLGAAAPDTVSSFGLETVIDGWETLLLDIRAGMKIRDREA
jgi:glycosyltransferase involved in cell wall biosynthesis